MDLKRIIFMNMLLEVYDEEDHLYYKSIVQEVNDDFFAIGIPMAERKKLNMPLNTTWIFRTTLKDALYCFNSTVIGRTTSGDLLLFKVAWPKKVERSQRRNYFRLPTLLDLHFWVLEREDRPFPEPGVPCSEFIDSLGEPQKAIALDLSGGGILVFSPSKLPQNASLLLKFLFCSTNATETVFLQGRVVREVVCQQTGTRYYYGISFENIDEKIREKIVQYIFAETRVRAQKGG